MTSEAEIAKIVAGLRPLGPIKFGTIHCAATPEGRDDRAPKITQMDIDRPDLRQPAYHFVVELDGNIVNTLPMNKLGAHTGKANTGNIGVCYVGGVDKAGVPKDTRTSAQKISLRAIVKTLSAAYPGMVWRGHRDWPNVAKACPSFNVATEL